MIGSLDFFMGGLEIAARSLVRRDALTRPQKRRGEGLCPILSIIILVKGRLGAGQRAKTGRKYLHLDNNLIWAWMPQQV